MAPVKDMALVEQPTGIAVFERLAMDPNIDVDKLERLMELYQKGKAQQAKELFFAAFSKLQADLPTIQRKGKGHQGTTYAKNDDIQEEFRPVLREHNFSLSFRTEFPEAKKVKIITVLAHAGGHEERTEFVADADTSGSKNAIQALGSTISYGKRYGTGVLLNITTCEERDDDGRASGKPEPPLGYDLFVSNMEDAAMQGMADAAWKAANNGHRKFATEHDKSWYADIKRTNAKAAKS